MIRDRIWYRKQSIRWLKKHLFTGPVSGPGDERYFRDQLYLMITNKRSLKGSGMSDFLRTIIYERSDEGENSKYLHFHDKSQKLSVDWAFEAWASKALDEIVAKLGK